MTVGRCLVAVGTGICGLLPALCFAQLSANPYAAESYDHNSNIFYLPSNGPSPVGKDGPTFADSTLRSRIGVNATYLWDADRFYATAEGRRFDYDHFTFLDHDESTLNAGLEWKALRVLDGVIDYRRERSMVNFTDLVDATQLILQTESNATASVRVQVTPKWTLDTRIRDRYLESPRPDAPELALREDSVHEAIRYLGVANLSAGLDLEYLDGKFKDAPVSEAASPSYHQSTAQLAATYIVSGLTNFSGNIGFTKRSDETGADQSGFTGSLGYKHNLTVKTSIGAQLSRAINSYVTNAGSEVDTTAQINAAWAATYKVTVNANYAWTDSKYPQFAIGPSVGNRIDHVQYVNLDAIYQVLRWLSIHPYVRYQTRGSNLRNYDFNSTAYGIEVQATLFNKR